jgi:hypothetical protein
MDMMKKIHQDVSAGISVLKKEGTSLFLKTMAEMDMLKYRYDMYKVDGHLSELYRELGERFIEAVERRDYGVLSSREVKDLMESIEAIKIEEERYRKELDNLRDIQKD